MGEMTQAKAAPIALARSRVHRSAPTPWLKPGVFAGALTPLAWILFRAVRGELGANPIAEALNMLGLSALIFLIASLACTPLKTLFGWGWPIGLRRMLGLFAFFYVRCTCSLLGLAQVLDWRAIWRDVTKRPSSSSASRPSC